MGLDAAVFSLTRPSGAAPMEGPEPTVDDLPLSPLDTWYGATCTGSTAWFAPATSSSSGSRSSSTTGGRPTNDAVGSNELMLNQTNVFRQPLSQRVASKRKSCSPSSSDQSARQPVKRAGGFLDVALGVVADAEREQLHQLAGVVLVGLVLAVLLLLR